MKREARITTGYSCSRIDRDRAGLSKSILYLDTRYQMYLDRDIKESTDDRRDDDDDCTPENAEKSKEAYTKQAQQFYFIFHLQDTKYNNDRDENNFVPLAMVVDTCFKRRCVLTPEIL